MAELQESPHHRKLLSTSSLSSSCESFSDFPSPTPSTSHPHSPISSSTSNTTPSLLLPSQSFNDPSQPFIVPTLSIYVILQRLSRPLDKYKYHSQSFFNYLLKQLTDPNLDDIIDWIKRKFLLEVTENEIYYLLYYIRIRIADPHFDYKNHHIFRAPSSKNYPKWSQKLKSLAYKLNVSPFDLHPDIPIPSEMTPKKNKPSQKLSPIDSSKLSPIHSPKLSPIHSPKLSPISSTRNSSISNRRNLPAVTPVRQKSSHFFNEELPKHTLGHASSLSALDSISSSSSSSSLAPISTPSSRLPRLKSTTHQIQQLIQEQKELTVHVSKLYHSKNMK